MAPGRLFTCLALGLSFLVLIACTSGNSAPSEHTPKPALPAKLDEAPVNRFPVIHVFVALADNVNQGTVPVSTLTEAPN